MAFENLPHVEANKEANQQSKQSSGVRPILVGALIVALLGTWGYIIWDKNNTRETIQQKETIIASTSNQRDELQKELEDATMRYDLLKTSHTKKDSLITAKDREIAEKKDKIRILLAKSNASAEELKEAPDDGRGQVLLTTHSPALRATSSPTSSSNRMPPTLRPTSSS